MYVVNEQPLEGAVGVCVGICLLLGACYLGVEWREKQVASSAVDYECDVDGRQS